MNTPSQAGQPGPGETGRHGRAIPDRGIEHGGADAGPTPRWDLSTNANPLGPSPMVAEALSAVDVHPYPDPSYVAVRTALAASTGADVAPDRIVVGAGASELIHRLVRAVSGPVGVCSPTFGEYEHAARVAGRTVVHVDRSLPRVPDVLRRTGACLFLCLPNSPDGWLPDTAWLQDLADDAARAGCVVAADLAYAPVSQRMPRLPTSIVRLHAPNKAHGATGIRAGWLCVPDGAGVGSLSHVPDGPTLAAAAPSWVLSAHGVAMLRATTTPEAVAWVADCAATLWRWRDELALALRDVVARVSASPANFVLVEVPDSRAFAAELRAQGTAVRATDSMGLANHLRIAAQGPDATAELVAAIEEVA